MTSLNHIPDHLRDRRYDDANWSPRRALIVGSVWTVLAATLIGTLSCVIGYYAPTLTSHWALAAVGMFVITSLLHAVMHHTANMVTFGGNAVALFLAVVILAGTHAAMTARLAALASPPSTLGEAFSPSGLVLGNGTAWAGMLAAVFCCKNGDSVFEPLFGMLGRNFLTGAGG